MNRTVRRILAVSGLAMGLMANRSVAQQVAVGDSNDDLVHELIVVRPEGTFLVNDDGSLGEQIDPQERMRQQNSVQNSGQGNGAAGLAQSAQQIQQRLRQTAHDSLQKAVGYSDQEWTVLLPKIQKIEALQSAVMPGSRLKAPTGGAETPASVVQLRASVQDFQKQDNASDAQLAQRLASVREAHDKVKVDLAQARKELTAVVTQRQEAILFDRGILAD